MDNSKQLPLLVWGASGFAHVVSDLVTLAGGYRVVGYLDDVSPERQGESFNGALVLGGREQLPVQRDQGVAHAVLGFGDCKGRLSAAAALADAGFEQPAFMHPGAVVAAAAELGKGALVLGGAVIDPLVRIGANAIVNKRAVIGHGTNIGAATHLGSGCCLGGNCEIGQGVAVGMGTVDREKVKIGAGAVVGAGSLVLDDIPPDSLAYGSPAKVVGPVA